MVVLAGRKGGGKNVRAPCRCSKVVKLDVEVRACSVGDKAAPLDMKCVDEDETPCSPMRASGLGLRGALTISRDMGVYASPQVVDVCLLEQ